MFIDINGNSHNIHLISFADGNNYYNKAKDNLITSAKTFNLFDSITVYSYKDLDDDFKSKHNNFITANKRGFGYWIWKPYIILKTLEKIPEGDIVLYLDVCTLLKIENKNRLLDYIDMVLKSNEKNLFFEFNNIINNWCKMDTILSLEALDICHMHELIPGIIFTSNNKNNRDFFNKWYLTMHNYHLIDDSESISKNPACFQEHRHDQSIFSILARKHFKDSIIHLGYELLLTRIPSYDKNKVIISRGYNDDKIFL